MTNDAPILTDRHAMHEGVCTFHDFLACFQQALPCRLIMTPWAEVKTVKHQKDSAEETDSARAMMDAGSFSGLPVVENGDLKGLYIRFKPGETIQYENTKADHFFPCDRDVLSLLRHMRDAELVTVLLGNSTKPRGLVTYADFSKRPIRVILFAVVAEVEYLLARAIDKLYPNDKWLDSLSSMDGDASKAHKTLTKRKEKADHWDATMPATTFADIGHLITAVKHLAGIERLLGEARGLSDRLRELPSLRNRVAHVVKPVIAGPDEIKRVANQVDLMFEWIDRWERSLSSVQEGSGE